MSSVASGRQTSRTGVYGLVPRPALTCTQAEGRGSSAVAGPRVPPSGLLSGPLSGLLSGLPGPLPAGAAHA